MSIQPGLSAINYDVSLQLLPSARHANMAVIPADPGHLLRWHPNSDSWDVLLTVDQAISRVQLKREHFNYLTQQTGLIIPEHQDFIGVQPISHDEIVIVSLVESFENPQIISNHDDLRFLHTALSKYYTWIIDTKQPAFLHDAFKPEQYAKTEKGITLLDIDPYFADTNNGNHLAPVFGQVRQLLRDMI